MPRVWLDYSDSQPQIKPMTTETTIDTTKFTPALAVRDLWAGYDGKPVLEAINLNSDQGDIVGIIG